MGTTDPRLKSTRPTAVLAVYAGLISSSRNLFNFFSCFLTNVTGLGTPCGTCRARSAETQKEHRIGNVRGSLL
jgi:bacterioferritin-associated ferredoxin